MELDFIFYIYIGKFIINLISNYLFDFESYKKIIMKESICIQFYIECFYNVFQFMFSESINYYG